MGQFVRAVIVVAAASALVLAAATPAAAATSWTYYAANAGGNPTNVACITDGNWVFKATVLDATSGTLKLGSRLAGTGDTLGLDDITISSGGTQYSITALEDYAFPSCVTNLTLPSTLTSLAAGSAPGTVRSLTLHADGVTTIPYVAFYHLYYLTNADIRLPNVTSIGEQCFSGNTGMVVDVSGVCPPCVRTFADGAFANCKKMTGDLVLTNLVSIAGGSQFQYCSSLTGIHIESDTLTSFPSYMFQNATGCSNLTIRAPNLGSSGWYAFNNLTRLTNDVADSIPMHVRSISQCSFQNDSFHGTLVLTNCAAIGVGGFNGCKQLTGAKLSATTNLLADAFNGDTGLGSVELTSPDLARIDLRAFYNCTSLTNLVIGSTIPPWIALHSYGYDAAFGSCPLKSVTFWGAAPARGTNTLTLILVSVAAKSDGTHGCAIYASKKQDGWTGLASPTNGAESAWWSAHWSALAASSGDLMGVYTNGAGRKAWIIHQESPYDKGHGGFVVRICDNTVEVPYDWVSNNCASVVALGNPAISNALVSSGANGLKRWESYALGLDPNNPASVVLCDTRQDADARTATFCARNVTPATNGNLSVQYVLEGSTDGRTWSCSLASATNAISLSLPSVYAFFRVRTDIVIQ